ncbi:unnamed protein product [Rotaria socialis]|uniref:Uncharacterized protein n=1 Tax=Rotaria socialis TaxID=392032 RepID=A0A820JFI9_9BILA|nr:unnamed protein product [Rotaria socialis]CAF4524561.1 unnamed protein product [Rotaria socialis]CAF4526270.1 unnamed protein product [Rotaria socialis]
MLLSWTKYSSICNRLIHTVAKQKSNGKKKVIVLGAGWGGFQFVRYLNRKKYDVTLVRLFIFLQKIILTRFHKDN